MNRQDFLTFLNEALKPELFKDYAPNGLQIEGSPEVKKIVTGVTACQALIDAAIEKGADTILVHHGYFWKGEDPCVVGMKQRRLKALLENNINLIAYHLPLDAQLEFGNNVELARLLGFQNVSGIQVGAEPAIVFQGELSEPVMTDEFARYIETKLNRQPLMIAASDKEIKRVAFCTGAAQDAIELAAEHGADLYLTGEVSERTAHAARELGIHFCAAGHHATERYGIKALGEHLAKQLDVECEFVDIDNPV